MILILIRQPESNKKDHETNGFYEKLITELPIQGINVAVASPDNLHRIFRYLPEDIKDIIWTVDEQLLEPISLFWQEQDLPDKRIHYIDKQSLINNPGKEAELIHQLVEQQNSSKERE